MILFMIEKPTGYVPTKDIDKNLKIIPKTYKGKALDEPEICLLSWNEITYQDDQSAKTEIKDLTVLKKVVFDVARADSVCLDMAKQFENRYGIDILSGSDEDGNKIINDVFFYFAHPCIGNLNASPAIRPMTKNNQYVRNWGSFNEKYMTVFTKAKINDIITRLTDYGLDDLKKTGRDQVKICWDFTFLARAIFGEATTYISKKLEKILALKLCLSSTLLGQLKAFIRQYLFSTFTSTTENPEKYVLWRYIKSRFDNDAYKAWKATEYMPYFMPYGTVKFTETTDDNKNKLFWFLYINLLEEFIPAVDFTTLKDGKDISADNQQAIENIKAAMWNKLPPPARAAIVVNSFYKILGAVITTARSESRAIESIDPVNKDSTYYIECMPSKVYPDKIRDIPTMINSINDTMCPWNYNRNEINRTVMTYRHYLMPLWGGSSGHMRGHINAAWQVFGGYTFTADDGAKISFVPCLVSAMFLFWRLFYDKRISGIHTFTETFEAAMSLRDSDPNIAMAIALKINADEINNKTKDANIEKTDFDIYELMFNEWFLDVENTGIPISIHILNRIHIDFWDNDVTDIDKKIDNIRTALAEKSFEIPMWSKTIDDYGSAALDITDGFKDVFKGIILRTFTNINVKVFVPPAPKTFELTLGASDRLTHLHDKLSGTDSYNFSEDFKNLPNCLCGDKSIPFLSEINFTNIKTADIIDDYFTFTAGYSLAETPFIKLLNTLIKVEIKGEMSCTVFDNKNGFYFSGFIASSGTLKLTDSLELYLLGVALESCFEGESHLPTAVLSAELKHNDIAIDFDIQFSFATGLMEISAKSASGVLTIDKIFTLFGGSFPFVIPPEVNIGLDTLSLTVVANSVRDLLISFMSEKEISLWGDKVKLTPRAEITIDSPFDKTGRLVHYTLLGAFKIGDSNININYFSDNTAMIALDKKTPLVISEILDYFEIEAKVPLEVSDFSADLCFATGLTMNLTLTVSEVLKITAGGVEFAIEEVSLKTSVAAGKFDKLWLSGQVYIAGFALEIAGELKSDKNYSISACCLAPINLIDFAERIAGELGSHFDKESLPEIFCNIVLSTFAVSYNSEGSKFSAAVDLDFEEGRAPALTDSFSINEIAFAITAEAGKSAEFKLVGSVKICKIAVALNITRKSGNFTIDGNADFGGIKIAEIAVDIGVDVGDLPDFITDFAIDKLSLSFNITTKAWAITLTTSAGTVTLQKEINGTDIIWTFDFATPTSLSADLLSLPLLGETVHKISPETKNLTVGDFEIKYKTTDGLLFLCNAFGENHSIVLYKKEEKKGLQNAVAPSTVHWFKVGKSFSVVTIDKVAIGLDGSKAVFLVDGSLAVSPLTFSLSGAGFGVGLSLPLDVSFYLSGFGVAFDNGAITIAGSFSHTENAGKECYSGALEIRYKTIAIEAIGEYSSGSFFAYAALLASIGGPPAFFVTGLSLGFGYNKALALPPIEKVADFPLITAVTSGFSPDILSKLETYITDSPKENFITAGVKFNSFKMVNGFLLLSVSFGKEFELGLLGTAEATVPPNCSTNPIARVVLEIKADLRPSDGVFSLEAMLASDSYILSKDCKLTGGFAAYFWFGDNEHSGDFAITLGGYHPAYVRPAHYPVVPRLGLLWNVNSNITISGEIYFALTPSTVMAGGKLSAVYQSGNIRAWFTAYADFLLSWKPFRYDISIGISVGASYRVDFWFIHHTFSIELGADLHIWGPEVMGTAYISWFIISFTVSFGDSKKCHQEQNLSWSEFKAAFFTDSTAESSNSVDSANSDILTLELGGIISKPSDDTPIADPKTLSVKGVSKIPTNGNVRASGGKQLLSENIITVKSSDGIDVTAAFCKGDEKRNLPAALWKAAPDNPLTEEAVIKDAVCGQNLTVNTPSITLFPKNCVISLDELYKLNTLYFYQCFTFIKVPDMKLSDDSSLDIFKDNEKNISNARAKFLADKGITEPVSMAVLAENADDYFAEEFLIDG